MKKIATLVAAMLAFSAVAAFAVGAGPFYAKGSYYNGPGGVPGFWNGDASNELTFAAGIWSAAVASDQAAGAYEGKIAVGDWSESYPASNQPVFVSGPGDVVHWTLDANVYADGWLPATGIAYNDHMIPAGTTFEVIGAAPETGNWSSGVAGALIGDVWSVSIVIGTPGLYDVKWRKTGDWGLNAGSDGFGSNANNASYTTLVPNEPVLFEFNQRNGRIRITVGGATPTRSGSWGQLKAEYK